MNHILCQIDCGYLSYLMQYQRILKQRNSLVKHYASRRTIDSTLLATYDQPLLTLAKHIYAVKKAFMATFYPALQMHYRYFVDAQEHIDLRYDSEVADPNFERHNTQPQASIEMNLILF